MSASAAAACAVPAAVCRPRTAAVRRAVLTLFFLGGFLALALAFGGSARAADAAGSGPGEPTASKGLLTDEAPPREDGARAPARLADDEPEFTTRKPAGRGLVGRLAAVVERTAGVTRPVGQAVHGVVGPSGLHDLSGRLGLGGSHDDSGGGTGGDAGTGGGSAADETPGGCRAHDVGDRMGTDADWPRVQANRSSAPEGSAPVADHRTEPDAVAPDGPGDGPLHGQRAPAFLAPAPSAYAGDVQCRSGGPHEHAAVVPAAPHTVPPGSGAPSAADRVRTRERPGEIPRFPG